MLTATISDPLRDPSQNGWLADRQHRHHAYFLPSSMSTAADVFATIMVRPSYHLLYQDFRFIAWHRNTP